MRKRKVVIGCVLTICMMLIMPAIPAFNTTILKGKSTNTSTNDDTILVDDGIYLTKTKIPILKKALAHIDNQDARRLVQEIVDMLSTKNVVTSNDIKNILETEHIRKIRVYTGFILSSGHGEAHSIPGYNLEEGICFYIGPAVVASFKLTGVTRVGLLFHAYLDYRIGYLIGFAGFIGFVQWDKGVEYAVVGVSSLIIILS